MARKEHWEQVYTTRGESGVSWFESHPSVSIQLLEATGMTREVQRAACRARTSTERRGVARNRSSTPGSPGSVRPSKSPTQVESGA